MEAALVLVKINSNQGGRNWQVTLIKINSHCFLILHHILLLLRAM